MLGHYSKTKSIPYLSRQRLSRLKISTADSGYCVHAVISQGFKFRVVEACRCYKISKGLALGLQIFSVG